MTDQMTSIVGHNEQVLQQLYSSLPQGGAPNRGGVALKSCFARELDQLEAITAKEKSLLD